MKNKGEQEVSQPMKRRGMQADHKHAWPLQADAKPRDLVRLRRSNNKVLQRLPASGFGDAPDGKKGYSIGSGNKDHLPDIKRPSS